MVVIIFQRYPKLLNYSTSFKSKQNFQKQNISEIALLIAISSKLLSKIQNIMAKGKSPTKEKAKKEPEKNKKEKKAAKKEKKAVKKYD